MITIFRGKLKGIVSKLKSEKVKLNFMQGLPFWTASLVAGLLAVLYAKLFAWFEEGSIFMLHHYTFSLLILTPLCFVFA